MISPRAKILQILSMSIDDRKKFKPQDGIEELAKAFVEQAFETKEFAHLKYLIEMLIEEHTPVDIVEKPEDKADIFAKLLKKAVVENG